jgi:hypothetical protein
MRQARQSRQADMDTKNHEMGKESEVDAENREMEEKKPSLHSLIIVSRNIITYSLDVRRLPFSQTR